MNCPFLFFDRANGNKIAKEICMREFLNWPVREDFAKLLYELPVKLIWMTPFESNHWFCCFTSSLSSYNIELTPATYANSNDDHDYSPVASIGHSGNCSPAHIYITNKINLKTTETDVCTKEWTTTKKRILRFQSLKRFRLPAEALFFLAGAFADWSLTGIACVHSNCSFFVSFALSLPSCHVFYGFYTFLVLIVHSNKFWHSIYVIHIIIINVYAVHTYNTYNIR